jgi:hypothetical protein
MLISEIENAATQFDDPMLREHSAWAVAQASVPVAKKVLERMKKREEEGFAAGQIAQFLDSKTHS